MSKGKEIQIRGFSNLSWRSNLVGDKDKYMFANEAPRYRFNVIGVGTMGQEHIRVTMLEGRATINGIYDPEPRSIDNGKQAFAGFSDAPLKIYDSARAACEDPDVDGLIICTPNFTHLELVREAAKSGKHILLEKPVATTIPDALEIANIATTYPAVFQVGLQYRYKSIYAEAIYEALERKTLGNIKTIGMVEQRIPFFDKIGQWNKFSRFSGGTLVEKCCHYFDLINHFAQARPSRVFASGSMAVNFREFDYEREKSDVIDNAAVIIIFENGIQANFQLTMFSPMFYEEVVICGDEGRLKAWENRDFLPGAALQSQLEIHAGENRPSRMMTPCYPVVIEESGHSGATFFEHVKFVDNINGGVRDGPSPMDAFWSVVVGVAAEQSVATGEVVRIDELLKANNVTNLS